MVYYLLYYGFENFHVTISALVVIVRTYDMQTRQRQVLMRRPLSKTLLQGVKTQALTKNDSKY